MSHRILTRRRFLQGAAVGAAALGVGGVYAARQNCVRLGLIGCGARGKQLASLLRWTRHRPLYGEIAAVCDVDVQRAAELKAESCPAAELYGDYRRLLERDDLDAVVIAAPDHWHTPLSLAALQAGKAVYCEKPLTLTIDEGKLLVRAAAESKQVFQVGTQQRSDWRFQTACELVRNGRLGKVQHVKVSLPTGSLPPTSFGGPFPVEAPPTTLDWDRWLGQAPAVEFCRARFDPFRWWFEYSGGFMTDWGAHHLDIVHRALDLEHTGPSEVVGHCDLPDVPNGYNTPREFAVEFTYPGDVRVDVELSAKVNGILFTGERGSLFVNRGRVSGSAFDDLADKPFGRDDVRLRNRSGAWGTANYIHMVEFLDCVRTGEQPISDVPSQHRTATACHLANIALRTGRKIRWDARREQIVGDDEASSMLNRKRRAGFDFVG